MSADEKPQKPVSLGPVWGALAGYKKRLGAVEGENAELRLQVTELENRIERLEHARDYEVAGAESG